MHIFVYEYACALHSGRDPLTDHLRAEGAAMLRAVLEDLHGTTNVTTSTLLGDGRVPPVPAHAIHYLGSEDELALFRKLAAAADYTLVIAPECSGILATRCRWVEEAGGRWLGSAIDAVQLTGDKLALAQHLQRCGVPTPACVPVSAGPVTLDLPAVFKPRDGAGSLATFLCRTPEDCLAAQVTARHEGWEGEAILQTFVSGRAASVAVLVGPVSRIALLPAEQHLSTDGRFHYIGGKLPLPPGLVDRAQRLALQAVSSVPGLLGYVGVDLILGDAADGAPDWVIEINPRLTTSYVGLRQLADRNLMLALLDIIRGNPITLGWRAGSVSFRGDGVGTTHIPG